MPGDPPDRFTVDFAGVTLLGVYRVEKKLAEGGMGSIYRAEDTNLERPVVIKVPHARFLGEPEFLERFSHEVEELIRLEHPHVARILARGEHEDVPFFVLQYLGGGSLEDRLRRTTGRLGDPVDVLDWLVTVAETLDFVHDRGIVHRDIKPANILFDEAGNVFLSDFGVAKVCDARGGITGTGALVGSPLYMAPEQTMGREVTAAADQYALAATVYEALAGRPPFDAKTPIEIIVAKGQEDPAAITDHAPDLPEGAASSITKALDREAAGRFVSCGTFADAYRAGLAEAGLLVSAPPRRSRRPGLAVLAVAVFVLLGVLGFFALDGDGPGETDPEGKMVLLDAGEEPREVLRYHPTPGAPQKLALVLRMKTTTESAGEKPWTREPPCETIESECHVGASADVIPIRWVITSGPRKGATANGRLTRGGILESLEFEAIEGRTGDERADLQRVAAVLRQLPVPFPDEPIGIGATWAMTEAVSLLGSRMLQTTRYRLVKREGDVLTLKISTAEVAPSREVVSLGPDRDLRISTFVATGEGESVIDPGMPFSVKSSYHLSMRMSGEVNDKPVKIVVELSTEVNSP
jgi:Protein kinase domain